MFRDRKDAGRQLAERLLHLIEPTPVVLGLPRGGVVVAAEIAQALRAPLDVLVVRKLGAPNRPELAVGAVTDGEAPETILNESVIAALRVDRAYLVRESAQQLAEVERRQRLYRRGRPAVAVAGKTVVLVDDGIATGATMRAGITALTRRGPARLLVAVPVAPPETIQVLRREVDEVVCLSAPPHFMAVGAFYEIFAQTSDEEVIRLLDAAAQAAS